MSCESGENTPQHMTQLQMLKQLLERLPGIEKALHHILLVRRCRIRGQQLLEFLHVCFDFCNLGCFFGNHTLLELRATRSESGAFVFISLLNVVFASGHELRAVEFLGYMA